MGAGRKHMMLRGSGPLHIELWCRDCLAREPDRVPGTFGLVAYGSHDVRLVLTPRNGHAGDLRPGSDETVSTGFMWRVSKRRNRVLELRCSRCHTIMRRSVRALYSAADRERRRGRAHVVVAERPTRTP